MDIALAGTLQQWLRMQLAAHRGSFTGRDIVLDVGAYHGEFAEEFLSAGKGLFREAVLFEPNPANFTALQKRFAHANNVRLENFACDSQPGKHEFFCAGETYTGSLLPYATATTAPLQKSQVRCVTLDGYLQERKELERVALLKIDTQGNDLRVLQGASALLRASRPWIVTELINVQLYASQAQPHEIGGWLATHGYRKAAEFNESYTDTGWLAWTDACFVPEELMATFATERFRTRPTAEQARKRSVWYKIQKGLKGS